MNKFTSSKFTHNDYTAADQLLKASAKEFRDMGEYKKADSQVLELAHRLESVEKCRQTVLALIQKEQKRREECQ
jgi:hypothetical protein